MQTSVGRYFDVDVVASSVAAIDPVWLAGVFSQHYPVGVVGTSTSADSGKGTVSVQWKGAPGAINVGDTLRPAASEIPGVSMTGEVQVTDVRQGAEPGSSAADWGVLLTGVAVLGLTFYLLRRLR